MRWGICWTLSSLWAGTCLSFIQPRPARLRPAPGLCERGDTATSKTGNHLPVVEVTFTCVLGRKRGD